MRTEDFDFELPSALIAQHPVSPRDAARLLLVGRDLEDRRLRDLPELLRPGDILVGNDTRVVPTRLSGKRGDAAVEVTLHKQEAADAWRAFARPAKKLKPGDRLVFTGGLEARVTAKGESGEVALSFDRAGADLLAALERHGAMPLPPYIRRARDGDPRDREDYQTIFAAHPGAVAAPTAGLHFTPALLAAVRSRGVEVVHLTLHVGAGTFLPIRSARIEEHRMHSEAGHLSAATVNAIEAARANGGRVIAVGTTSLRLLESALDAEGRLRPFSGETDIFIRPGYRFGVVDMLLTNFHLPRSTLFILVSAFAGSRRMRRAYEHAIAAGYRFYSYGDACLLSREAGT
jgi:S-adenosylmethionine:tRNA ribosyltransferase-isomerase